MKICFVIYLLENILCFYFSLAKQLNTDVASIVFPAQLNAQSHNDDHDNKVGMCYLHILIYMVIIIYICYI